MVYYNENDPKTVAWLRELIKHGHIADGIVDDRSILDVEPNDLEEFTQCHFFAGIGGWSYALRLAGWPDDRSVWTGSCPCQPFSAAGKGAGFADERHLWPAWFHLIEQRRPRVLFGEQVASALEWLDLVQDDLEAKNYAFGAFDLCAAGIGAPHIRQRLWFVADSKSYRRREERAHSGGGGAGNGAQRRPSGSESGGYASMLGDTHGAGVHTPILGEQRRRVTKNSIETNRSGSLGGFWGNAEWLRCADNKSRSVEPGTFPLAYGIPARMGRLRGYGNAIVPQVAQALIESYMELGR